MRSSTLLEVGHALAGVLRGAAAVPEEIAEVAPYARRFKEKLE